MLAHERGQNRVDALLHLGVGQRAIGAWNVSRTDRLTAAVRHCPCPDSDRKTRSPTSGAGDRVAGRLNGATNDFRRQGIGDDDREIADDERIPRQRRGRVAGVVGARRAAARSRFSSATNTRSCRGSAARVGDRRRQLADERRRSAPPFRRSTTRPLDRAPGTARSAGSNRTRRRRAPRHSCSTTPLTSKKSTSRAPPDQCSAPPRRSTPSPTARVSPASARTASPISNSRRRAGRGGGCARPRRPGPGSSDGRSVSNLADSGFAMRDEPASVAPATKASRRLGFDEAERHGFGQAGGASARGARADRAGSRGSGGGAGAVTTGNVGSSLSKP